MNGAPAQPAQDAPLRGRAIAKAILFGEHAVVHGAPALAVPVSACTLEVELRAPAQPGRIEWVGPSPKRPGVLDPNQRALLERMVECAFEVADPSGAHKRRGAAIHVRSDIPLGSGLGSSAALGVALIRALQPGLRPLELARLANEIDRVAHGNPSGIDAHTIATERPLCFERGRPITFLVPRRRLSFALAVLPREGSTRELVAHVERLRRRGDPRFEKLIETATETSRFALAHFFLPAENGAHQPPLNDIPPLNALGDAMDRAGRALNEAGLCSPAQEALCEALREAGALGAKLSGAGGGGATLALLPERFDAEASARLLETARRAGALSALITTLEPPSFSAAPDSLSSPPEGT